MHQVGYYCTDISRCTVSKTLKTSTDLFPPRLTLSPKLFQVTSIHSLYNSALFSPPYCCPFLLYVVANLICIFLSYRQMILLSALTKFLRSFCGQKRVYSAVLLKNFILNGVSRFLSSRLRVQISLLHNRMWTDGALYVFILDNFWNKSGLKVSLRIPPYLSKFC